MSYFNLQPTTKLNLLCLTVHQTQIQNTHFIDSNFKSGYLLIFKSIDLQ